MASSEDFKLPQYVKRGIEHFKKLKPFAFNSTDEIATILTWVRPNEPDDIKTYRILIFQNELLSPYNKIMVKFNGINKADGFSVNFPDPILQTATGEDLQSYTENTYPYYGGFQYWFWNKRFKSFITDANSWTIVMPAKAPESDAQYGMPVCFFVFSEYILDFKDNEYVSWFSGKSRAEHSDKYEFDTVSYRHFKKGQDTQGNENWVLYDEIENPTGILTACRAGGYPEEVIEGRDIYTSILSPIAPFFTKAMNILSDEDGARINHMHPMMVVHETDPCATCNGTGFERALTADNNGRFPAYVCSACKGERYPSSPFGKLSIRPALNGEVATPNPAAYYVERPIELLKFISQVIKEKVKGGFQALGFDYMDEVPINQSGIAKEYDRSEGEYSMHRMAMTVAEHLQALYYYMAAWRQPALGQKKWQEQVPSIVIPEKFDIVTSDVVRGEMEAMKNAGFNNQLIGEMQMKFAKKKFGEKSKQYLRTKAMAQLDPFPSATLADKITMQNSPAVDLKDIYTSLNLDKLLNMAEEQDEDFYKKDVFTQRALIQGIADNNLPSAFMSRSTPNRNDNSGFEIGSSGLNYPQFGE
jgi:hypothetical protein